MRQVVLDTETTGLETVQGHRIIELGCIELVDRRFTERRFHHYIRPDRDIDLGAEEVHGITREFLQGKPRFADIAADFLAFVGGAEVVIHNAPFDVGFLNYELGLLEGQWGRLEDYCIVIDSLVLARSRHPGQRNSLDALCSRYGVDSSHRDLHGALLDAEILAEVYLAMTGGQASLDLVESSVTLVTARRRRDRREREPLKIILATFDELQRHLERLDGVDAASGGRCLWKELDAARSPGPPVQVRLGGAVTSRFFRSAQ